MGEDVCAVEPALWRQAAPQAGRLPVLDLDEGDVVLGGVHDIVLDPGGHQVIFCSGLDRGPAAGMQHVLHADDFIPAPGWNTHTLTDPIVWDGSSNRVMPCVST